MRKVKTNFWSSLVIFGSFYYRLNICYLVVIHRAILCISFTTLAFVWIALFKNSNSSTTLLPFCIETMHDSWQYFNENELLVVSNSLQIRHIFLFSIDLLFLCFFWFKNNMSIFYIQYYLQIQSNSTSARNMYYLRK